MVLDTLVKVGSGLGRATVKTTAWVAPKIVTGSKHVYKFGQKEVALASAEVDIQKAKFNKDVEACAAKISASKVDFMDAFNKPYTPEVVTL